MELYKYLKNVSSKFYVLKAFKYMFTVCPLLMVLKIVFTIIKGFTETINASLMYMTLDLLSTILEGNQDFQLVIGVIVLMILAKVFLPVISAVGDLIEIRITQRINIDINANLMKKISGINYEYFDDKEIYDLITRTMKEAESKITGTVYHTLQLLSKVISVVGISYIVISIAWWMLPLSIMGTIPMFCVKFKSSDELNKAEKEMTYFNRVSTYISNIILNKESMKEIKLFHIFDYLIDIWKNSIEKSFQRTLLIQSKYGRRGALVNILYVWVGAPLTFINILFVIKGVLTLADYMVLLDTVGTLGLLLVHEVPACYEEIRKYKLFWDDMAVLWKLQDTVYDKCEELKDCDKYEISFSNVYFRYPYCDKYVLNGLSFTIRNGEKVAIVGENGAGKSTIIKLLLGLYKPSSGFVTVNNYNIYAVPIQIRRKILSCVFQDFTKYLFSVRENIGFGDIENIEDTKQIKNAAVRSFADSFIQQMPQKYDTILGNIYGQGTDLSEGQWQKINIAKAYNMDSHIIILDEPTAALDPISEAEIYHTFRNLSEDKTCLMVSHRLGSARIADRILVIHEGKVLEDGNHEQLMDTNGKYYAMFESQSKWYQGKLE